MKKIIGSLKQKLKDFYKQLPNKLEYIKAKIDEIKPAVVKNAKVIKDSGLIVSAFIGSIMGLVFGVMIGIHLYSYRVLIYALLFVIVSCIIGLFKKHYLSKENSRIIELIDTLLYTELVLCVPVLTITVISLIF
ncbi:hypothetical protein JCM17380_13100 [Desulfosporosinus burensis]